MDPAGVVSFQVSGHGFGLLVEPTGCRAVSHGEMAGSHGPRPHANAIGTQPSEDRAVADVVVPVAGCVDRTGQQDHQADGRKSFDEHHEGTLWW